MRRSTEANSAGAPVAASTRTRTSLSSLMSSSRQPQEATTKQSLLSEKSHNHRPRVLYQYYASFWILSLLQGWLLWGKLVTTVVVPTTTTETMTETKTTTSISRTTIEHLLSRDTTNLRMSSSSSSHSSQSFQYPRVISLTRTTIKPLPSHRLSSSSSSPAPPITPDYIQQVLEMERETYRDRQRQVRKEAKRLSELAQIYNNLKTHPGRRKNATDTTLSATSCHLHPSTPPYHPTCNTIHEWLAVDDTTLSLHLKYKGEGSQARVYQFTENNMAVATTTSNHTIIASPDTNLIWKTRRYAGKYVEGFTTDALERHVHEAVVLDQATGSPFLPDLYQTCVMSSIVPLANGASLRGVYLKHTARRKNQEKQHNQKDDADHHVLTPRQSLKLAFHAAQGLADLHTHTHSVHLDLDLTQYMFFEQQSTPNNHNDNHGDPVPTKGIFRLGDLNFGKALRYQHINKHNNENADDNQFTICPDTSFPMEDSKYKAPEDMESILQTGTPTRLDKSDVFSLGNALFQIATLDKLWKGFHTDDIYEALAKGERPTIPGRILQESQSDPSLQVMLRAMRMCFIHDPHERSSAQQVSNVLLRGLLDGHRPSGVADNHVERIRSMTVVEAQKRLREGDEDVWNVVRISKVAMQ